MNSLFKLILAATLIFTISSCSSTYYIVRHAEKLPNQQLSPAGFDRADDLWEALSNKNIDEVYTTHLQRTIDTAQPTVDGSGIVPNVIPAHDVPQLVKRLRLTSKKNILVVGHSDTVPRIIDSLMLSPQNINISKQYDNLFIIEVKKSNGTRIPTLTQTTYGVPTP